MWQAVSWMLLHGPPPWTFLSWANSFSLPFLPKPQPRCTHIPISIFFSLVPLSTSCRSAEDRGHHSEGSEGLELRSLGQDHENSVLHQEQRRSGGTAIPSHSARQNFPLGMQLHRMENLASPPPCLGLQASWRAFQDQACQSFSACLSL